MRVNDPSHPGPRTLPFSWTSSLVLEDASPLIQEAFLGTLGSPGNFIPDVIVHRQKNKLMRDLFGERRSGGWKVRGDAEETEMIFCGGRRAVFPDVGRCD